MLLAEALVQEVFHSVGVPFLDAECFHNTPVFIQHFDNWHRATRILHTQASELVWTVTLDEC